MFSTALLVVALAGAATAITPPGFEPASSKDLFVAFGNTSAINGKEIPKADTAKAPTIGTTERLTGTYAVMMVDPDIPPQTAGGPTSELLHWMQAGLVSANTTTTIGGQKVYELINPMNTTPIASYLQPSPPNIAPTTHRYTQLLMQVGNSTALTSLQKAGMTRGNFSAVNVVKTSGLAVLAGNSFNVSNTTGLAQSNITMVNPNAGVAASSTGAAAAAASATGSANATNGTSPKISGAGGVVTGKTGGSSAVIAMVAGFAVAVMML